MFWTYHSLAVYYYSVYLTNIQEGDYRGANPSVKANVATEVQLFVYVIEILAHFLPRWEKLAVVPFPPEILAGILVNRTVGVDPGSRITVPVPDAADIGPRLEDLHREPQLSQAI
jgi:hypothetical protein